MAQPCNRADLREKPRRPLTATLDFLGSRVVDIDRSTVAITDDDLNDLYSGSISRLAEYFVHGAGEKWGALYDVSHPIAAALCQGAAMHYYDKTNGVKDFDVWFFYPFKKTHLPYRTIWNWDYKNPKFGHCAADTGYVGRRVDVLVRSIRENANANPVEAIQHYLESGASSTAIALAKKAVVMLYPVSLRGTVIWYGQKI